MKMFKIIFFIIILSSMNLFGIPGWDQDPDNRTYRATASITVTNLSGDPVPNISGTFVFKMNFDTDGDGHIGEDEPTANRYKSESFITDQQGNAFVELFITVPRDWYNGWKHVYVSGISGQINGTNISIKESYNTYSNTYFNISPSFVVIPDGDKDNISDDIELQLAEKFKPVIHRHPDDRQINLENIEILLSNSAILKGWNINSNLVYNDAPPPLHYIEYNDEGWIYKNSFGWGSNMPSPKLWRIDFNITKSSSYSGASIGNRPLYYHIYKHDNNYYVQYWYFFTMNDVRGETKNNTWHEGDWEHVGIKLNDNLNPIAVNFYQHYGGHTRYASECWWSSSSSTSSIPNQGFSSSRTHLHIWISKNGHASYNKNDLVYNMQVDVAGIEQDDFQDQCDYYSNQSYFEYDFMEKLGEIKYSENWLGYFPKGNSKYWLPFVGNVGEYWRLNFPSGISTPSPKMPPFRRGYYSFTVNTSRHGFGNSDDGSSINIFPSINFNINGESYVTSYPLYFYKADVSWKNNNSGL